MQPTFDTEGAHSVLGESCWIVKLVQNQVEAKDGNRDGKFGLQFIAQVSSNAMKILDVSKDHPNADEGTTNEFGQDHPRDLKNGGEEQPWPDVDQVDLKDMKQCAALLRPHFRLVDRYQQWP